MTNAAPGRIVLLVDDNEESKKALAAFADANLASRIDRHRQSGIRLVRLPAVFFTVQGKPYFIEGLEAIRRQFLSKYSRAS